MSPRSPEQSRRMREKAREKILAGSLEVFAERGFADASMRRIAERSGVSKGLAYHYFESKEELLATALRAHLDRLLELTERTRQHDDPADRLAALIHGLVEHVRERPDVFRTALALILQSPRGAWADAAQHLGEPIDAYLDRVHEIFRELGAADPDLDAALFRSALLGLCLRLAGGDESLPVEALRDRLLQLFAGEG